MRIKNLLLTILLAVSGQAAMAQQNDSTQVEPFKSHWYAQAHVGMQYTLGEVGPSDLFSPNAEIAVGYQITPVWGVRLDVNGWQSRGGSELRLNGNTYKRTWAWNYIAPSVDATINISNLLFGYNKERIIDFGVFFGVGGNFAFYNDEAAKAQAYFKKLNTIGDYQPEYMYYLWDNSHTSLLGKVGYNLDFRVSDRVKIGMEYSYNIVDDHYNSKKAAGRSDHYFNLLVGAKVAF